MGINNLHDHHFVYASPPRSSSRFPALAASALSTTVTRNSLSSFPRRNKTPSGQGLRGRRRHEVLPTAPFATILQTTLGHGRGGNRGDRATGKPRLHPDRMWASASR